MAIVDSLIPEFDHETATTRALLERVPESRAGWKPHAKSMSIGDLAMHIAAIPVWASITLERKEFDVDPPDGRQILFTSDASGYGNLHLVETPDFDALPELSAGV